MPRPFHRLLLLVALGVMTGACGAVPQPGGSPTATGAATRLPPTATPISENRTPIAAVDLQDELRRPLHLPLLTPGEACPTSASSQVDPDVPSFAVGNGPVYPARAASGTNMIFIPPPPPGQPATFAMLWLASPSYQGSTLVRGHQIDGNAILLFEGTNGPVQELILDSRTALPRATEHGGWRQWRDILTVSSSGCYAFQMDGLSFSEVAVVQIRTR